MYIRGWGNTFRIAVPKFKVKLRFKSAIIQV